ncbi:MAG: Gfo/Idh/MocA family oxidoreductase [Gemmatimonadetes bacterium]|nr:Gfo/Idh/MocA family oxidoreductase [Gemmatimonadota bacterium]
MSASLRLGIVGTGAIAQLAHLPVLAKLRGAELVAVCDNDGVKARALADRFGVPDAFTDIDDLLEFDALDAVVIATPNHLHEPHVLAALSRGVHVLCERPLALTPKGIERIIAAAARADRKVVVGNNHRFRADVQALSSFLRGGELGKLTGVRAGAYHPPASVEGWRRNRPEAGGGAFLEHGFTQLDLALWLADFPDPVRVSAYMDRPRGAKAVEESMLVVLEAAGGITCTFDISWSYVGQEERWWFEALATRGSARLAPLRVVKELNGRPVDVSPSGASARDSATFQSYRAQDAHFLSVIDGTVPYKPPTDQLVLHRTLDAIYKAANEEKEIRL